VFGLTAPTSTVNPPPTVNPPRPREPVIIQIGSEGGALLRGTVDSVGAGSIVVKSWGGKWTVRIGINTQILPKVAGDISNLSSNFKAGDFVGVLGRIADSPDWTINATFVRNWTEWEAAREREALMTREVREVR
jgi:hypothetical protein